MESVNCVMHGSGCGYEFERVVTKANEGLVSMAPFASLKKQAETLFQLICCERKTLLRLKKQAEKDTL